MSAASAAPTYAELASELSTLTDDMEIVGDILSQVGAMLHAMTLPGARTTELVSLAQFVADSWANDADLMRARAAVIAKQANDAVQHEAKSADAGDDTLAPLPATGTVAVTSRAGLSGTAAAVPTSIEEMP